jgi:Tol biopolymer transport system component
MLTTNTNGSQAPSGRPMGSASPIAARARDSERLDEVGGRDERGTAAHHGDGVHTPVSWSPDGKNLLYYDATRPAADGTSGWFRCGWQSATAGHCPKGNPAHSGRHDGRWIAYTSDESGAMKSSYFHFR